MSCKHNKISSTDKQLYNKLFNLRLVKLNEQQHIIESILENFKLQDLNKRQKKSKKHMPFADISLLDAKHIKKILHNNNGIIQEEIKIQNFSNNGIVEIKFNNNDKPLKYLNNKHNCPKPHSYTFSMAPLAYHANMIINQMNVYLNRIKYIYKPVLEKYAINIKNEEILEAKQITDQKLELLCKDVTSYYNEKYEKNNPTYFKKVYLLNLYPQNSFVDTCEGTKIANCYIIALGNNNKWNIFFDYYDSTDGFEILGGREHFHEHIINFNKLKSVTLDNYQIISGNLTNFWASFSSEWYNSNEHVKICFKNLDEMPTKVVHNI